MNQSLNKELNLALNEMRGQSLLYQPSSFWEEASRQIALEINEHGIDKFRALPIPLGFFVPTYGSPGNSFTSAQSQLLERHLKENAPQARKALLGLQQFLSGESGALADYRVLLAADNLGKLPHLHNFSESTTGSPIEQFEFDGRKFSRSSLNYLNGLALLKRHIGSDIPSTVLEIGGGFGTLGEVLSYSGIDNLRYIDIDIPPTSIVAQYYLQEVAGRENVSTYALTRNEQRIDIQRLKPYSVLCSWQIERLQGQVDLFVNFISFQEMEPNIVENYVKHINRLGAKWILLRNMREGKQIRKPGEWVGVDKPIRSEDYLGMLKKYELIDNSVHPFGYRTVDGYHSELLLLRKIK